MSRDKRIIEVLNRKFSPEKLNVINESHLHAGHMGDDGTGETHYRIEIKSAALGKLNRVERQRQVNKALDDEFNQGLHALSVKFLT